MVLVQLDNVSRMFGRFPALRKVSFSFIAGHCYVLLGENGAGKSTLLRILAGLLEPSQKAMGARVSRKRLQANERASAT
jgi:ABC-type multidrug transport system ATPase subunit